MKAPLRRSLRRAGPLTVALVFLMFPASAWAQWFQWSNGSTFTTFGPNSSVTMDMGQIAAGTCDTFFPATNVFVVSVSSIGDGAALTDVSNPQGLPNTIIGASGGVFVDETIAFTAPGGSLGSGTYGIVFDECQDGHFNAGTDTLFYPAFEVVIPANIPILPSASIAATKAAAQAEGDSWSRLVQVVDAIEAAIEIKEALECLAGGIGGCIVSTAISSLEDWVKETAMGILGLTDPKDVARDAVMDQIGHFGGIAADPPDANFQQLSPLGPTAPIVTTSANPLETPLIAIGNASRTEGELLGALLHSLERYQGADLADNGDWALVHARAVKAYSDDLLGNLPATNAALQTLANALVADTRNLDTAIASLNTFNAQVAASGFDAASTQALANLGQSAAQIAQLRTVIASKPSYTFTETDALALINEIIDVNVDLTSALSSLSSDMDGVITTLTSAPNVPSGRPIANAGGPYSGTEGAPLTLDGTLSADPNGSLVAFNWDLDRDGQFDDATGVSPSVTFPAAFTGMVGLQVTDNEGNQSVEYANVTIANANSAPAIDSATPAAAHQEVDAGSTLAFSVTPSDPDGDSVSVRWLVDFVEAGTGSSFAYSPTVADLGSRLVTVEVSDGQPGGGVSSREWSVAVLAPDLDGDGWRSNADCDDGNPLIHPGSPEIIGNGIDDDCNAATLDAGTPPVAAFTRSPSLGVAGQPVQFTDTSVDPDAGALTWAWTFGDGGSSTLQNPAHTYAAAGTFTVTLTVTDPQGFSSTASQQVTVTNLPVAGFTFSPSPAIRTLPVQFTDTSVDLDGPISSWAWNFGDGGISNAQHPAHAYDTTGDFTVTLVVTDGDGATATATQTVTVEAAPDDVQALQFVLLETNCGWGASYNFSIGGVHAATLTPGYDCTCGPAAKTVTVTDPALLALVSAPVCQTFELQSTQQSYVGWARVEIVRNARTETIRIVNTNGVNDPYSTQVCNGFGAARTFTSALPNQDGDAIADCTDPDIDGDGVDNVADNCATVANAGQADFNSDGVGDACQDTDHDTLLDAADNCPAIANTSQFDFDHDGEGNACDADIDNDTVLNAADNCPYLTNPDQADANGDGRGDRCDIASFRIVAQKTTEGYATTMRLFIDSVEVGSLPPEPAGGFCGQPAKVVTISDPERVALLGLVPTCNAFRITSNGYALLSWAKAELVHWSGAVDTVVINDKTNGSFPQQACYAWEYAVSWQNAVPDTDGDGIYNCEDADIDSDGVLNSADNCPLVANPGQEDVDGNGLGNACQDTDADTVLDINDNCPLLSNSNQANIDGDSLGDACDPDRDNDTVDNAADNCPNNANSDQANIDGDSLGDVCDSDMDGDTVANTADNCLTTPNTNQVNTDGDAQGDACDADKDNDGVLNAADNCELRVNSGQEATNPYGVGDACVPIPITVPWLGVPTQPHQVYDGGSLVLQGVAIYDGDFAPATLTGATWDPGDGTGPVEISVANGYALELTHTYTGAPNTPYTAVLTIRFGDNQTRSDEFRVLIQPRTLDVEANMAIDRGLWNLHKTQTRTTVAGASGQLPASYWFANHDAEYVAGSAATVNAFGINNHRVNGNRLEDPYVEDVRRGLTWLESRLVSAAIGMQPAGNPDTNGNGIGLYTSNQVYQSGQVADAFVAAGLQTTVAVAGHATWVRGRTYRDLVQDIMDGYWYGQVDAPNWGRGGWHYGWNYGSADNSTAQWGAITGLAGENAWNIPVPQFVKDENLNHWMKYSQDYSGGAYHGSLGYNGAPFIWSNGMSTTPSGIVQMNFDGVRNDPTATTDNEKRFQAAVRYMAKGMRNAWHTTEYPSGANYYSLFAMAKAFRLAVDTDGSGGFVADPVVLIDDVDDDARPPFDWYRNDPAAPGANSPMGVARLLISRQLAGGNWQGAGYWDGALATAYSVIILSPTIFELGPAAMCTAVPSIAGAGDAVSFDASGSVHNDPFGEIASYSWNFQDGTAVETNTTPQATHAFSALGTYNVLLTVTDQNGLTASASCPVQVIAGNRPPIANSGGPYDFCVASPMILDASASSDPEGSALTYAWDLTAPLNFSSVDGTAVEFDATAALSALAPGSYQIGLRVTDDQSQSHTVFTTITIWPADDPDHCNSPPELTVSPNLTAIATGADGAQVSYVVSATDAQDGALTPECTPPSNSIFPVGSTVVTCSVTDSGGLTDSGEFSVTVVGNAPEFVPPPDITTQATSAAGAEVTFTAAGTDVEDGSIAAVCAPPSGSTFPIGTTTVNCTVTDSQGLSASGSFAVTVLNAPPVANDGALATDEDTAAAGQVTSSDPDGPSATYSLTTGPAHGALTLNANGSFTYSPGVNYCGADAFTFGVSDGIASDVGVFTITVVCVNDAPVANDSSVTTPEDTPVTGQLTSSDVDGPPASYALVTGPAHGTLAVNADGGFTYTPAANYCGADVFTFQASDGSLTDAGTVTIDVTCVNDAPVANDSSVTTPEDTAVPGQVTSSDVDGPAPSYALVTGPAHGTLVFNADGSFTYTPAANYCGADAFTFQASDGSLTDAGTVTIDVTCVNDAPVADDGSATTPEDTPVTGQLTSSDVDGPPASYALVTGPAHGTLAVNADGSFTYTPAANYCGADVFTFQASDGSLTDAGTVTIDVTCVNDAPVANDSSVTTPEDTAVAGQATSSDVDGPSAAYSLLAGPSHGTLVFNADGSFTYTPAANYCGADGFTFQASDGSLTDVGAVTIDVTCVNDAPVADDGSATTPEDTPVTGQLTSSDVDGPPASYALVTGPAHGTLAVNADGSFTYTPAANYCGADAFTFQVSDGSLTDTGAVTIDVTCVNDAPVANDSSVTTPEDTAVPGQVTSSDVDGPAPSYALVTGPAHGTLVFNADGSFTYTPAANYCGADAFTFQASDGSLTDAGTVTIDVTCVNDAPVANDSSATTPEDTPVSGQVTSSDIDGPSAAYTLTAGPAHGTLVFNADGTYTYTPQANYFGPDSFTFEVADGAGGTDGAQVSIAVTPVNDAPICIAAAPSIALIWPPNHQLVDITIGGVVDPVEGSSVTTTVTGIFQDEPTNTKGDGNTPIDGYGVGTATAQVRAERSGTPQVPGDGRVYHILFTGTDAEGATCTGTVKVGVPHDQGQRSTPVDGGPLFKSTGN